MTSPAFTFNREAHAYRRDRPGYPQAIAAHITQHARLSRRCRILEIGCGTGQASALFTTLEPRQTCIDPGADLLAQARDVLGNRDGFDFVCSTFEDYFAESGSFDLIYAATSFHWLARGVRFTKAFELLAPGACLAVFTDRHLKGRDTGFFQDVQSIYADLAPELLARPQARGSNTTPPFAQEAIERNPLLHVHASLHDRELVYTSDHYIGLLRTFSNHIALGSERLDELSSAIKKFIDAHHNGHVTKVLTTSLDLYRKPA